MSGLERHLEKTGSSIASRFSAECSSRVEQVDQCSENREICRVFERQMIAFYASTHIEFGRVRFGATPRENRK